MRTWAYPAVVEQVADDEFVLRFADMPGVVTGGDTLEETLALGADALEEAILGYLAHGMAVPDPRPARKGEHAIVLDPMAAARVVLSRAMAEQRLSQRALAARMGRDEKAVRRILTGKNASFSLTLAALRAVGVRVALTA